MRCIIRKKGSGIKPGTLQGYLIPISKCRSMIAALVSDPVHDAAPPAKLLRLGPSYAVAVALDLAQVNVSKLLAPIASPMCPGAEPAPPRIDPAGLYLLHALPRSG